MSQILFRVTATTLCVVRIGLAQIDIQPGSEDLFDRIENEVEELDELDDLQWLQEHPYDLNRVTRFQLQSLPGVSAEDANKVVTYRRKVSRFGSLEELERIPDLDKRVARRIKPFVMISREEEVRGLTVDLRTRTVRDLQVRRGFREHDFLGSPFKSYIRLAAVKPGVFETGLLHEKDAGERMDDGLESGYLLARSVGPISRLMIGDYGLESGQGLVLWKGAGFGKGGDAATSVKKSARGIQPHRSTDEFNFQRGVALSTEIGFNESTLDLTTFFSSRRLASTVENQGVSSFYESGLFRTATEVQKEEGVRETMWGTRLTISSGKGWVTGATMYKATFDRKLFTGGATSSPQDHSTVAGVDAEVPLGDLLLFGEAARHLEGGAAWIAGMRIALRPKGSAVFLYRSYSDDFANLHAKGFGERDGTSNEHGFYLGLELKPFAWLVMNAYVDLFRFPVGTSVLPAPASGRELLLRGEIRVSPSIDLSVRYVAKVTQTMANFPDVFGREVEVLQDRVQDRARFGAVVEIARDFRWRARIEGSRVKYLHNGAHEDGFLLYQDVQWKMHTGLTVETRLIFFDTDSFDSRLYEYENDLRGVFSNPALFGQGMRWYVLFRFTLSEAVSLSIKYAETQKDGVKSSGSGLNEIDGDLDNRISAQLDLRIGDR